MLLDYSEGTSQGKSFARSEGGIARMNTDRRSNAGTDDDNATWNGNSTQQL